ncbi:MAG: hypothetical protein JRF63_11630 [Deltaproteobacteria bacterium]|nr:hypothetical protein [Deltaproteobacteria bacterium]
MALLQPDGAAEMEYRALEEALEAHLQRLELTVRLQPVGEIPTSARDQEELARRILGDETSQAVVWIDPERRTVVLIHLDAEGRESRLERHIDCIAEHIGSCADTIASVVSSAVSSWVEPALSKSDQQPPEIEYAVDNELSPVELNKQPWTEPDPLIHLSLGAGYGGILFDGTVRGAHGFDVGLWLRIARYVMVEAVLDFWWPVKGDSSEIAGSIEVGRFDVVGRVGGALPIDRFVLTLTAGAIFDFADVEKVSKRIEVAGAGETRKGFSTALSVRIALLDWFSIWLGAGLDVLDADLVYRGTDPDGNQAVMVRCSAVQGRLFGGIEVVIGIGTMGDG